MEEYWKALWDDLTGNELATRIRETHGIPDDEAGADSRNGSNA
jgi:hypothetical protein